MKKLIMITLTVVMGLAAMAFPAFASSVTPRDNSDSYVSIYATNVVKVSTVRVKDNYSCVYFYPKSDTISHVRVRTYGYNSSNGVCYNKTQIKTGQMVSYVVCRSGVEYQIYNTIRESGYRQAVVGVTRNDTLSTPASVYYLWSPDCVGSYTPAY